MLKRGQNIETVKFNKRRFCNQPQQKCGACSEQPPHCYWGVWRLFVCSICFLLLVNSCLWHLQDILVYIFGSSAYLLDLGDIALLSNYTHHCRNNVIFSISPYLIFLFVLYQECFFPLQNKQKIIESWLITIFLLEWLFSAKDRSSI